MFQEIIITIIIVVIITIIIIVIIIITLFQVDTILANANKNQLLTYIRKLIKEKNK